MSQRIYAQRPRHSSDSSEAYKTEQEVTDRQLAAIAERDAERNAETERVLGDIDEVLKESLGYIAIQAT